MKLSICALAMAVCLQAEPVCVACTAPVTVQPQGTISCKNSKELLSQLSDCYGGCENVWESLKDNLADRNLPYYQEVLERLCNKAVPTKAPTAKPTKVPTAKPTKTPTAKPTKTPTATPTKAPTAKPTKAPTVTPTKAPTVTPTKAPTATPTKAPTQGATGNTAYAYGLRITELVNEHRAEAGLQPVEYSAALSEAAQVRAKEIQQSFAHTRPDGRYFSSVLKDFGISYRTCGENIAWGQKSPEEVVTAWMNSPGHRANILNANYTKLGVGCERNGNVNYFTQLFTN